jgi:hypothetical protein
MALLREGDEDDVEGGHGEQIVITPEENEAINRVLKVDVACCFGI